jgi:crotonobetainyl-CoA:carnitine CoA-transferase CaiB-like acyl-CoA transferase
VNLKHVKGREILVKLVGKSDVLVENFRPGVMGRLGLSYEELSKVNKGLVYCSVSGFGQYGPYSQLGGYDLVVQAMSGLMYVTGKPEDEPMRAGVPIVDILAAYNAAAAIIAALYATVERQVRAPTLTHPCSRQVLRPWGSGFQPT